jgi:hypothetical protein
MPPEDPPVSGFDKPVLPELAAVNKGNALADATALPGDPINSPVAGANR